METALKHRNLIELFNQSLAAATPADKIFGDHSARPPRDLDVSAIEERAETFAMWLLQNRASTAATKLPWSARIEPPGMLPSGVRFSRGDPGPDRPRSRAAGRDFSLQNTDARGLILADDYGDENARYELSQFADAHKLCMVMMTDEPLCGTRVQDAKALEAVRRQTDADDTAVILCTSGTTGDPREVELTHRNLVANIQGSVQKIDITGDDVLGHILPPHHSFGMTVGKFLPLAAGATNIYTNKYRDVADLIRERRITIFIAIPALYTTLAKKLEDGINRQKKEKWSVALLDRYAPRYLGKQIRRKQGWTQLRFFLSGAAPMPRWVLEVLWRRGFKMYEGYGTTENSPVYGFNDRLERLGSVGKPINTLAVKIMPAAPLRVGDEENRTLPPHQRGEICLGGPCIAKGYFRNPKATEAVFSMDDNGVRWLRTGDLGYLDEDGNLCITGRKKYLIVLPGGKNVNPERVEATLSQAQFVKEVLVVPTRRKDDSGLMEESVRALVQPAWELLESHTGRSQRDLLAQPQVVKNLVWESIRDCQQRDKQLSGFEKIAAHHLEIHPGEFIKTSTGKIKREHYMNLEHLEAKHTPIAEYTSSRAHQRSVRDAAGT